MGSSLIEKFEGIMMPIATKVSSNNYLLAMRDSFSMLLPFIIVGSFFGIFEWVILDPNGTVLEAGTGNPREIAVIVPVDGILRIAVGSVYNFYEFEQPLSDRLTDSEWRLMIGATYGDDYSYARDDSMDNPEWTKSYREEQYDYSSWY